MIAPEIPTGSAVSCRLPCNKLPVQHDLDAQGSYMSIAPVRTKGPASWSRYAVPVGYVVLVSLVRIAVLRGSTDNTLIDVDQFLVPIVFAAAWRLGRGKLVVFLATFLAAATVTGVDVLSIAQRVFCWEIGSTSDYMRASGDLPWLSISVSLAILLGSILAIVGLMIASANERPVIWPLLAALPAVLVLDATMGVSRFVDIGHNYNIAVSPGLTAVGNLPALVAKEPAKLMPFDGRTLASEVNTEHAPAQVLSVAYESWGLARDRSLRDAILQPLLRRVARGYRIVENDDHAFRGATLAGEMRELCGLQITGVPTAKAARERSRSCLPARLAQAGYATQAFHGNGGEIYARDRIYPAIGFRERSFYKEMMGRGAGQIPCAKNIFLGLCDEAVFRQALTTFDGKPRFVHVMTLDTHLPILSRAKDGLSVQTGDSLLDAYLDAFRHSMDQLGRSIAQAAVKPDRIYLYGDHTPPFFRSKERDRFVPGRVPFLVLDRMR